MSNFYLYTDDRRSTLEPPKISHLGRAACFNTKLSSSLINLNQMNPIGGKSGLNLQLENLVGGGPAGSNPNPSSSALEEIGYAAVYGVMSLIGRVRKGVAGRL